MFSRKTLRNTGSVFCMLLPLQVCAFAKPPDASRQPLPQRHASNKVTATVLSQENQDFGHVELLISKEAVRIDTTKLNATILARGPSWDVYIFNKRDKTSYSQTYANWIKSGGPNLVSDFVKSQFGKNDRQEETKYRGWPAHLRTTNLKTPGSGLMSELLYRDRQKPQKLKEPWEVTLITGTDFPVNPKIFRILECIYQFPTLNGPPLGTYFTSLRGNRHTILSTTARSQKLVDDSIFDSPKGLKTVPSVEMAITGGGVGEMMQELMLER